MRGQESVFRVRNIKIGKGGRRGKDNGRIGVGIERTQKEGRLGTRRTLCEI